MAYKLRVRAQKEDEILQQWKHFAEKGSYLVLQHPESKT